MNLDNLERLVRHVVKGEDVAEQSNEMMKRGYITPAEHKSLASLSWQIAANVNASGTSAGTYALRRHIYTWWI